MQESLLTAIIVLNQWKFQRQNSKFNKNSRSHDLNAQLLDYSFYALNVLLFPVTVWKQYNSIVSHVGQKIQLMIRQFAYIACKMT